MKIFKTEDLPAHVEDLLRDVAAGKLSLVTKDGKPVFMAVPFTDAMLCEGMSVSLAVKLFDEDVISLGEGARMAHMTLADFMIACSERAVPVVRYPTAELEVELANIYRAADSGQ